MISQPALDSAPKSPRIGVALGAGSARGLAHLGVLRALDELGLHPDIVCGTSMGALVGAVYCTGHSDELADWVAALTPRDILRYMEIRLRPQGGVAVAGRLMTYLRSAFGEHAIEELTPAYAAVATDLYRGRETWLQKGSVWDAVRASIAIPGMLTPVQLQQRWLVDGALVNPVPVSLCRALGADVIIAVNVNTALLGRGEPVAVAAARSAEPTPAEAEALAQEALTGAAALPVTDHSLLDRLGATLRDASAPMRNLWSGEERILAPGTFNVMATALNVMQDRITRSRLAGEPPDVVISPRLGHIGLLEFNRGPEAIDAGYASVMRMRDVIEHALGR